METLLKITWDDCFEGLYSRRALRVLENSIPVWRAIVVGPYFNLMETLLSSSLWSLCST